MRGGAGLQGGVGQAKGGLCGAMCSKQRAAEEQREGAGSAETQTAGEVTSCSGGWLAVWLAVWLASLLPHQIHHLAPTHPTLLPLPTPPTADDYRKEQKDYFSHTAAWTDIHPSQVVGAASCFKTYDLHTVTLEELKAPLKVGGQAPCI